MKIFKVLIFFSLCLLFAGCGDNDKIDNGKDGKDGEEERPETLAWIEDTMRKKYLWPESIKNMDYTLEPKKFFESLLSDKDGKFINGKHEPYSRIEKLTNTRGNIQEVTYGFEFIKVTDASDNNNIKAIILYVLPNSPASDAGLERGDWIIKIDDSNIVNSQMADILYGDVSRTFTVAHYNSAVKSFVNLRQVKINGAVKMENNPILIADVIQRGSKKVGYLVYNSFDNLYNDELRKLSSTKFNGVDEFVLDLRYNNGGFLDCVRLLCAILAPEDKLNTKLLQLIYKNNKTEDYYLEKKLLNPGGKNLNMKRVYILVSSWSASASEAMINLLKPYMDVIIIGRQTEGKNVGSQSEDSNDKIWRMHPITCYIANSKGEFEYSNGFTPTYEKGDVFDYNDKQNTVIRIDDIYPLGNQNERLLKIALDHMDGITPVNRSVRSIDEPLLIEGPSSLQRKAINSVIINTMQ